MEVISTLLIVSIFIIIILISNLSYKNHCIEDLETRLSGESKRKNEEFLQELKKLMSYQSFEPSGRETCTRNLIEDCIKKYSKRDYKPIKNELSISDQTKNR